MGEGWVGVTVQTVRAVGMKKGPMSGCVMAAKPGRITPTQTLPHRGGGLSERWRV